MQKQAIASASLVVGAFLLLACTDKTGLSPLGSGGRTGKGGSGAGTGGTTTLAGGSTGSAGGESGGLGGGVGSVGGSGGHDVATGGVTRTGGAPGTGGMSSTGGAFGTGGMTSTGGASGGSGGHAGGAGGSGAGGTTCVPPPCVILACVYGYGPTPPCGCPTCLPPPDAGMDSALPRDAATDVSRDVGPCLPVTCIVPQCRNGLVPSPSPCHCPTCAPDDAGAIDADRVDASKCPPIVCPMIVCPAGIMASPTPCGCPVCGPLVSG